MTTDIAISFAVLLAVVVAFISGKIPVGIVAIGAALALYFTGILNVTEALAGFGDPTVIFIATLFVVSEGLDASGVTAWAGQELIGRIGDSRTRLMVLMTLLVAGLTALISVNGAVAALLPVIVVLAVRLGRSPSQLLIPLVFGAHAGSMLALTGTPVNVIISQAAADYGGRPFGFFEFALVGIPLVIGAIVIILVLGERLLPTRQPKSILPDLSRHARTLVEHYGVGDRGEALIDKTFGMAEVVIRPRSGLIGEQAFPGMTTESGDLTVLAVQRKGENQGPGETTLAVGDVLLLQGSWSALDENLGDPDVLVVDAPELVRRAVPLGLKAAEAIIVLVGMVIALVTGLVPSAIVGLVAASALVLLRVVTPEGAYRSISWTTVVLIAGMIPLSTAMTKTGAAGLVADNLVSVIGGAGPYALLIGLFLITAVLGQLISNMATALIVIPIAAAAAIDLGVSVQPVLMSVTVAAAASFITPVATPVNMMVMGPGGYRFGDYWKLGSVFMVLFFLVSVFLVPVFWPF